MSGTIKAFGDLPHGTRVCLASSDLDDIPTLDLSTLGALILWGIVASSVTSTPSPLVRRGDIL